MNSKEHIREEFRASIETNFGNIIDFSFFSGRFAFDLAEKHKSDIDCIVVLKDIAYSIDIKENLGQFVKDYIRIHEKNGYIPDLHFSGDIITQTQVSDAIHGRGFDVSGGVLTLSPVLCEEDFNRPDMDYRIWRHELCFNNNEFVFGDSALFEEARVESAKSLLRFILIDNPQVSSGREVVDVVLNYGRPVFGVDSRYSLAEKKDSLELFQKALDALDVDRLAVSQWATNLVERITNSDWKGSHLYNWESLREIANRCYASSSPS
jgi:hypothetical protein